jgi:hypothetical protein
LENSKPKKYHITEKLLPPLGTQKTQVCWFPQYFSLNFSIWTVQQTKWTL